MEQMNATNKKTIYKINDIDIDSLQIGERAHIINDKGQWVSTSPVISKQVAGRVVMFETANSVYTNSDRVIDEYNRRSENILDRVEDYKKELAEKCINEGKKAQYAQIDLSSLCVVSDGKCSKISIDQIKPGMHIIVNAQITNMETFESQSGKLNIPCVQGFTYNNGSFVLESRGSVFTNIDLSKTLSYMKARSMQQQIER